MRDILSALRQLRKSPAFAATVILTMALGIGANTAIFTLVHAILLRSLPVSDPGMLYRVGDLDYEGMNGGFQSDNGDFPLFSYDLYKYFLSTTPEFDQLAAMQSGNENVAVQHGARAARVEHSEYVSGNYFKTLGVGSFAGRMLADTDDTAAAAPAAVMSYAAWQSDFGSDPHMVGSTLYLQNKPVTVIGIAPPGFYGDRMQNDPPALWIPLALEPVIEGKNSNLHLAVTNWLYLFGRVQPGVSVGSLQAQMSSSLRQWLVKLPAYTQNGGVAQIPKQHVVIVPGGGGIQNLQGDTSQGLYLLMAISGLVLLVACANVANLLLARGSTRKAEIALRMALGGVRSRLIRQMLTESIVLGCLGGLAGVALAYAGVRLILALAFPDARALPIDPHPSLPVLGFAVLLSLATGVVFGIVPAWIATRAHPAEALHGISRSAHARASLPQRSLIVFQVALSLVMLAGAGLLTRTLANLQHQDFGLQPADRYVLHLDPAGAGYSPAQLPALYQALEQRFGSQPGIADVGLALYSPLEHDRWGEEVYVTGRSQAPSMSGNAAWDRVNPQFFASIGEPVRRGRNFSQDDTATSQPVAIVNQTFAKKFFPGRNPIGQHFGIYEPKNANAFEIVGVAADAKYVNPREPAQPMYFRPLMQELSGLSQPNLVRTENSSLYIGAVVLHYSHSPQNVDAMVRRTLAQINPNLTVINLRSFDYQIAGNFSEDRLVARLALLFGLLALVLAAVGLYGLTAYQVARRTAEIGLRMALGANRANVVRMVLRGALVQVALGLTIGLPIAILGAHAVASQLYGVHSYDPASLGIAVAVLAASAVIAGLIPAWHAAGVDPVTALRTD